MKTFKFFFFLSTLSLLFCSCDQKAAKNDPPANTGVDVKTNVSLDEVVFKPLKEKDFIEYKNRWEKEAKSYMAHHKLTYFDMDIIDLTTILTEDSLTAARFYLGMAPDTLPHLMLVGVQNGQPSFSIIADYTTVCPPFCK